jgi:hypothetical protein
MEIWEQSQSKEIASEFKNEYLNHFSSVAETAKPDLPEDAGNYCR